MSNRTYHINPTTGVPTICRNRNIRNCPYSGETGNENHFDTYREAQLAAQEFFALTMELFSSNVEHDQNEIMEEIEKIRKVKKRDIDSLSKEKDFELIKKIHYTEDENIIMGVIEGEICIEHDWKYISAALQNSNISRSFLNEALFDYSKRFSQRTRGFLSLNHSLTHDELVAIIENREENLGVRSVAFLNPALKKEYVLNIIEKQPELLERLPHTLIIFSPHKSESIQKVKNDLITKRKIEKLELSRAMVLVKYFKPSEQDYSKN